MSKLLNAKPIVEKSIDSLQKRCGQLKIEGLEPKMAVILVGNSQASLTYIKNKKKLCQEIGASFELFHLDQNISEADFLKQVESINNDSKVTGFFIQLPLPKSLSHLNISKLVDPKKDVDGFHPNSSNALYLNKENAFIPCTPKGILKLLSFYNLDIEGKNIVIIGRSLIVGKPLSLLLSNKNATVTLCHSKTKNIKQHTKNADIIISAVGNSKFLTAEYLSENKPVIIDVGINRDENDKLCGDIDFESVKDKVSAITPVPGGVGPLTVLSLMENLIQATENILKGK